MVVMIGFLIGSQIPANDRSFASVGVPGEDDKPEFLQVAIFLECHLTNGGLEAALVDVIGQQDWIFSLGTPDGVDNNLHCCIGWYHKWTRGILILSPECLDQVGVGRVGAKIGRQGHQQTFGGVASDSADIPIADAFRPHVPGVEALFARLPQ